MNKRDLKKLSKSKLIEMLFKQKKPKIIVANDTKPIPKKVHNLDNLFNDAPFPDFKIVKNDPFEKRMNETRESNEHVKTADITCK